MLSARTDYGILLDIKLKTGELFIAAAEVIQWVKSAKMIPEEERWVSEVLWWVKVVPGNFGQGHAPVDEHISQRQ